MRELTLNEVSLVAGADGEASTITGAAATVAAAGGAMFVAGVLASYAAGLVIGETIYNSLSESTQDAIGGTIAGMIGE